MSCIAYGTIIKIPRIISKIPIIKKESNSVAVGIKSSGMGVAIGSYVGKSVADILLD